MAVNDGMSPSGNYYIPVELTPEQFAALKLIIAKRDPWMEGSYITASARIIEEITADWIKATGDIGHGG